MQLTIIGAGAIGGTIGAHLARDGHEILLCDTGREHVDAINRDGLRIEGPVENFTVEVPVVTAGGLPGVYRDLVVGKRKTEVDTQIGGLRGPLTGCVTTLIHAIERGERQVDVANLELLAECERAVRAGRPLPPVP